MNKMDSEMMKYLIILGFKEEDIKEVPTMKTVLMYWRRKAPRCHPDKGGVKEEFQKLQDALNKVGDMINELSKNNDDEEEVFEWKLFKDFNLEKENSNSFTILIESERSEEWNATFIKVFGEPFIPSDSESNGRHWNHNDYTIDGMVQKISITLWKNPKNKQPKLLIQSPKHMMTMMWVTNELPNIFMDVMKLGKKQIQDKDTETEGQIDSNVTQY